MTATLPDRETAVTAPTPPPAPRPATPPRAQPEQRASRAAGDGSWTIVSTTSTMVAIVCLWLVAQMLFLSSFSEDRAQGLLYQQFRTDLANATASLGPTTPVGDPVAL
ncbi:MAG TPA: hypothetical protein VFI19_06225, partial [Nocardioides sp.]|nr:hypothetical protein [Nocardioides sp.]